jgi:hypothetical protein
LEHGKGCHTFTVGDVYSGPYREGKPHGYG